ncbi:MAG: hypothetical protein ABEJ70_05105 [Halobacteriaceae archaeon]
MALVHSLVAFVVSALVGGLGIYVGGRLVTGERDYEHAVWTALIGAFVWAVVSLLFGWFPVLGPVVTLLAWVAVINWRYPGGWVSAAAIGLVAWLAAIAVLWVLARLGVHGLGALGVPGA